jgi:dTDP-4-dehydrorhamnose reductase
VRALVVGAEGQLGRALVAALGSDLAWAGGRERLDARDGDAVARLVAGARPDVIFNAAAYNAVDRAESEPEQAFAVNAVAPAHLARAARAAGALMVHVSSDYVFDGDAGRAYVEDDRPAPVSLYGASKAAGELAVAACGSEHLIVRTSGVFGAGGSRVKGGSFVERILSKARAGEALRVVDDQVFAPTYAPDLAAALVALAARGARGLYHVTNEGRCSWHELAVAALELAGLARPVARVSAAELALPARRPAYSVLASRRLDALGLPPLRPWREALRAFLDELNAGGTRA